MSAESPPFRAIGTPRYYFRLGPSTSAAYCALLPVVVLDRAYGQWAMRVKLTGASSAQVQLQGSLCSSSEGTAPLRPLTTYDATAVNTSDDVVFVTGKPLTAIAPYLSLPSSSQSYADVWICGSA